jgi:SAM-dependent methyltransferase
MSLLAMVPGRPHPASLPSLGYDSVFYPARSFPTTHPEHLATVLTLLGLRAPPIEDCRVLEIGCATGGNLLPMAESLPGAQFVGVDLSPAQIQAASALGRKLGIKNIEFRCQDLCDFHRPDARPHAGRRVRQAEPLVPEAFDYIIAHGVYSWISPQTREKLMALCARHLAPGGVAYVSYNTLPGWHAQSAIRELMFAHVWGAGVVPGGVGPTTPQEVAVKAREVLDYLASADPAGEPFAVQLRETATQLRDLPYANLLHDHLCPHNDPVYFSQFAAECSAKGLRYLGDARTQSPHPPEPTAPSHIPEEKPVPTLSQIAPQPEHMEFFQDVWGNRPFRQSLLCRAGAPPAPIAASENSGSRSPFSAEARYVPGLFVGSAMNPTSLEQPGFGTPAPETFITPRGITATVSEPLARSAMLCLADAWPARLPFDVLLESAWQRMGLAGGQSGSGTGADRLAAALLQGHISGLIELSIRQVRCAAHLTRRPIARALSRVQAETDDTVTTLRHDNLQLNATARSLLRLLDGSRDLAALSSEIERIMLENAHNMDPDIALTDADRRQIAKGLQQDLRRFVDEGLLIV